MHMDEYLKVKDMTYLQYCNYLQDKYGIGLCNYMTSGFNVRSECKRTKEGLLTHHKKEDTMVQLSTPSIARLFPISWQSAEELVYCDLLEHLLLHVLIYKYPSADKIPDVEVGIGGIINYIVPELNDVYSGWKTNQVWRYNCHSKVINDVEVYLAILGQFMEVYGVEVFDLHLLFRSMNAAFGLWDIENDYVMFYLIGTLWKEKIQCVRRYPIGMKERNEYVFSLFRRS